ncbi:MAG: hypothetical protein AAGD22_06110 [Verrucomicrobiota bacterium]
MKATQLHVVIFLICASTVILSSCASLYTRHITFERHPVAVRVKSEVIHEDEPLEYSVVFRNVGREIMTFDYTIGDEPDIPHVDKDGPNSGLIENLYPGQEIEVENPMNKMTIWATLGTVTYGKQTRQMIEKIYDTDQAMFAADAAASSNAASP